LSWFEIRLHIGLPESFLATALGPGELLEARPGVNVETRAVDSTGRAIDTGFERRL